MGRILDTTSYYSTTTCLSCQSPAFIRFIRSDLRQGLITLPILRHLERAEDDAPVNAVLSGQRDEEHVRAAIEAVCSWGAIEASLAEAQTHARRSQEALAILPDNASRHTLCSLAEYIVERRR